MKIAIIDTIIQKNKLISDPFKFEQIIICNNYNRENQILHGTNIANIILDSCSELAIEILSIAILDNNKKGSLGDLLKALKIINKKEISVVNISLGVLIDYNFDKRLSEYVDIEFLKLKKKKVAIISAYHNSNKDSYPANSVYTLGVKNDIKGKDMFCIGRYCNKIDVIINRDESFVRNRNEISIKRGNSYLCAKISALYCIYKEKYFNIVDDWKFGNLLVSFNELLDSKVPDPFLIKSVVVSNSGKEDKLYKELVRICNNLDVRDTIDIQDELCRGELRSNYLISEVRTNDNFIDYIIKKIMLSSSELTFCYLMKQFEIKELASNSKKAHFMYL